MATPCWPAPVSAITRVLPMRLVSSAWPSTLLILCEPVWLRSSRLSRIRAPPACSASFSRVGERRRAAGVVAVQAVELVEELAVAAGLVVGGGQLVERRDERLRDEPPAVAAEVAVFIGLVRGLGRG